jgi:predicted DsbA family dithiol-disulfide isomerase
MTNSSALPGNTIIVHNFEILQYTFRVILLPVTCTKKVPDEMTSLTTFNVKIYSDTICPWVHPSLPFQLINLLTSPPHQCYIGLRTLEQAIALYQRTYPNASKDIFHILWSPYYLDANLPTPGILASTRIAQKNGADRAEGIKMRLKRVGQAHGIDFSFAGKVGNTRDSHRMMYLAGLKGEDVQMKLAKELFAIHFEGDTDITCHEDLLQASIAAGLAENEAMEWLYSDNGGPEVDEEAQRARHSGVSSVPTFEINGTRFEGAEDVSAFYQVFTDIKSAG